MAKDMTAGKPFKLIVTFAVPLLIGNIFQQFYNMVDTIIVGRYVGVKALAAVGATGSLMFLFLGFLNGMTGGFSILIAQAFGAKRLDYMRHCIAMAIELSVALVVVLTAGGLLFMPYLLEIMKTPSDIIADSLCYINIICCGFFATMLYNLAAGILRAIGDSKTPLYFLMLSSVLNIVLDLVFVINFHLGVAGVAYATVISQAVAGVFCYVYMIKKYEILRVHREDFRRENFRMQTIWKLMRLGIPMSLQFSITALGSTILQSATNTFGYVYVAAFTAANKVEQITVQPFISLGATLATYVGQNLGAGHMDRIRDGIRQSVKMAIVIALALGVIVYFGGHYLIQLFLTGNEPGVMQAAQNYIHIMVFFYIPLGMIFIFRNSLQGMGDALIPMLGGVCELVMRSVAAFVLAQSALGFLGVCMAGPLAWCGAGGFLTVAYLIRMRKYRSAVRVPRNKTRE